MDKKELFKQDNYYQVYLDKCINLAHAMVIKSEYLARYYNRYITDELGGVVDELNPKTWKYYLNISGEYHYLDELMTVISVDTLEEIEFTKDNLELHHATKEEYRFNTLLYHELLSRYPNQEMLILGILYPCDIDQAIDASDGKILSYPPYLVEFQEYDLISDLEVWIKSYLIKTNAPDYSIADNLFPLAQISYLHLLLVQAIITLRKARCKTNQAHSYHIRRYLASHGFLDEYLDALTLRQSLRFYFNIRWVERNIGKSETQTWLIREIMTERGFPVSEYSYKQDFTNIKEEVRNRNFFEKNCLNELEYIDESSNLTLNQLLLKEDRLAFDNPEVRIHEELDIDSKLKNSLSSTLDTKVLESTIIEHLGNIHHTLPYVLINLWLDWSDKGIFKSVVYFDEVSSGERRSLSAKDAFILYFYCYLKYTGLYSAVENDIIPRFLVQTVPRHDRFTREELLGMTEYYVQPKTKEEILDHTRINPKFADYLLKSFQKPVRRIVSIREFFKRANAVYRTLNEQLTYAYYEPHYRRKAYKEGMVYRMYMDRWVDLTDSTAYYSTWLKDRELDLSQYERRDYGRLMKQLFDNATGIKLDKTLTIGDIHKAMLSLLKQLSSYSVQYIDNYKEADIFPIRPINFGLANVHYGSEWFQFVHADIPDIIRKENSSGVGFVNWGMLSYHPGQPGNNPDPDRYRLGFGLSTGSGCSFKHDIPGRFKALIESTECFYHHITPNYYLEEEVIEPPHVPPVDQYGIDLRFTPTCIFTKKIRFDKGSGYLYRTKVQLHFGKNTGYNYREKKMIRTDNGTGFKYHTQQIKFKDYNKGFKYRKPDLVFNGYHQGFRYR